MEHNERDVRLIYLRVGIWRVMSASQSGNRGRLSEIPRLQMRPTHTQLSFYLQVFFFVFFELSLRLSSDVCGFFVSPLKLDVTHFQDTKGFILSPDVVTFSSEVKSGKSFA